MGYTVAACRSRREAVASDLKVDGLTIENSALKVTVDKQTGCITSLYDKKTNFEVAGARRCGNQLQTFKDLPKEYRRVEYRSWHTRSRDPD